MKFELHSRIERTARGTGRKYKQWVFVGMTEFTAEFLNSQQRKGQYVMFETCESVYRVVASVEEIEELAAIEAAEAAKKEESELEKKVRMIEFVVDFLTNSKPEERLVRNIAASQNGRELFSLPKVRRAVKKAMKAKIARQDWSYQHEDLINSWQDSDDYGESFHLIWVIKGNTDNAKRVLDEMNVPWEGVEIHSIYDCTGREFRRPAWFREIGDRTFVTQSGGLDV